jgi:hypothetical protein
MLLCMAATLPAQGTNYYAISTLAGNATSGDGEPASTSLLATPLGAATDASGNIYFIDQRNYGIRRISPTGVLSTVAVVPNAIDLASDRSKGDLIVITDHSVHRVTAAGRNHFGGDNGPAVQATLNRPSSVARDSKGQIDFSDQGPRGSRRHDPDHCGHREARLRRR